MPRLPVPRLPAGARFWRWSLRTRLTVAATAVLGLGLAAAGTLLVLRESTVLRASLDSSVTERVERLADLLSRGVRPSTAVVALAGEGAVQVVGPGGQVLASSGDLTGQVPVFTFPTGPRVTVRSVHNVPLGENGRYVVAGQSVPGGIRIYVGLASSEAARSVADLTRTLLAGIPVLTLLLGAAGWLLIGLALRPVDRMRRQAAAITATDLHNRLDVPAGRDELHRLGITLNDLLRRLDSSSSAQRQFVADAAHELRSPLAGILAHLEIAARRRGADQALATELLPEAQRLRRLVEDLLRLARMDAGPQLRRRPVDLDDLVFAEVRRVRALGPVPVDESGVGAAQISGDADALTRVVGNLLDNASRHARTAVTVALREAQGGAELTVADDGPGVPAADRERVFERFTRLDNSRSRDGGGSGLGLAIVRDVVSAHGGSVLLDERPGGGARFRVTLPRGDLRAPAGYSGGAGGGAGAGGPSYGGNGTAGVGTGARG